MSWEGAMRPVAAAVLGNLTVTVAKFIGFALTGSSAIFAEALHSLADTLNQTLLWIGLHRSTRKPDDEHQFGYGQERYFWNLVSAVAIFFLGGGYTVLHAIERLQEGYAPVGLGISLFVLALALVVEGFTLFVALREFNRQRRKEGKSFREWLVETRDPTTLAVLVEDSVAVLGVGIAILGIALGDATDSIWFDTIAAVLIGVLMGALAIFLATLNRSYLINRADPELNEAARREWGKDVHVQSIPRVSSIVFSPDSSVLMAEVELREETMFQHMSPQEVAQVRRFVRQLNEIRKTLEDRIQKKVPRAKEIFVEFTLPEETESAQEGAQSRQNQ